MIKILIVKDLDGTHFENAISSTVSYRWMGGDQQFWINLYSELVDFAAKKGAELIFSIATKKLFFDNVSEVAVKAFQPFLSRHNPHMYTKINGLLHCLVNQHDHLTYECLENVTSTDKNIPSDVFSHFEMIYPNPNKHKSEAIKRLADKHHIPLSQAVLLDDTPAVLLEAKESGIQTISFECFFQKRNKFNNFDVLDLSYVKSNLARIRQEIFDKVDHIIKAVLLEKNLSQCTLLAEEKSQNIADDKIIAPAEASPCTQLVPYSFWNRARAIALAFTSATMENADTQYQSSNSTP